MALYFVLGGQVVVLEILCDQLVTVNDCEALDAGQDEVLGHFASKSLHSGHEDLSGVQSLLRLETPQPNLSNEGKKH